MKLNDGERFWEFGLESVEKFDPIEDGLYPGFTLNLDWVEGSFWQAVSH